MTVVALRRTNGSAEAAAPVVIDLEGELLADDVVVLGGRLRAGLDAAGIRERRCAVALPAGWVFAVSTLLPNLAEEDLEGFIELEAERGFPYGTDQLSIVRSQWTGPDGLSQLTLLGVPIENITRLEQVLKAARLQAVSLAPALTELQEIAGPVDGAQLDLLPTGSELGMLISAKGGVVAYRSVEGVIERDGDAARVVPDLLGRELRVTLGQIPAGILATLRTLRVFGAGPLSDQVAAAIRSKAEAMGLTVVRVDRTVAGRPASPKLTPGLPADAALAVGIRQVGGREAGFEFLPPHVSAWQQFMSRYSSGRLMHAGIAAGVVALLVIGAFGFQQARLMALGSEWNSISKDVRQVEDWQAQVKKFRPWFDGSVKSLMIMKTLTEAFPEDGLVTAKTIEIRDQGTVVCSGTARDSTALLRTLDKLRAAKEVTDVQVDQLRGKSPLQFNFNFRWDASRGQQ
jgi:hypothetical protein